jgi:glycolate oxidase FAD binding subunit
LRPASAQEAAELLKGFEKPVRPVGGGTKPWLPARDEEPLETGALDRVLEHNVGDFTAVLEAGVPFAEAQRQFAEHGQRISWDPPEGGRGGGLATIGGIVASADSGPLRHRYGGVRDLVVGIHVVLSDGTIAKAGGKVIKNVAGYDLSKLFAGSFGTLGLITSVAVRLHPLPDRTATVVLEHHNPDHLLQAALELARRPLEADRFDVVWTGGHGRILMEFSGASALDQAGRVGPVRDVDWDEIRGLQRGEVVIKVSGRPTDLAKVIRAADDHGGTVVSRAALGLSWIGLQNAEGVPDIVEALAPRWCQVLDGVSDVPGPVPGQEVMDRLKARFDPSRIFRPGVFVGGI